MPEESKRDPSAGPGFWTGTISFGLVSIPVSLLPATRPNRFSLRTLGPKGTPLSRRYVAPDSNEPLEQEEMVRGYEVDDGKHVVITQEELDRLAPEKSRDINLQLFTDRYSISPLYLNRPYFLVPSGPSTKAYRLLAETMEKTKRTGIATFVMRGKEHLVAIFAENKILLADTLRWADEVRSREDIGIPERQKPPKELVREYAKLIEKHSVDEIPREKLHDERIEALNKLVEKKRARNKDIVSAPQEEVQKAEVVDILEVLKRALAKTQEAPAAKGEESQTKSSQPAKRKRAAPASGRKRPSRSRTAA